MKRINLEKYGFARCSEKDHDTSTEWGTFKTKAYKINENIYINKDTRGCLIWIYPTIEGTLTLEQYETLPHYEDIERLKGVCVETITIDDLEKFKKDCVEFKKEYEELEKKVSEGFIPEKKLKIRLEDRSIPRTKITLYELVAHLGPYPYKIIFSDRKNRLCRTVYGCDGAEMDKFVCDYADRKVDSWHLFSPLIDTDKEKKEGAFCDLMVSID